MSTCRSRTTRLGYSPRLAPSLTVSTAHERAPHTVSALSCHRTADYLPTLCSSVTGPCHESRRNTETLYGFIDSPAPSHPFKHLPRASTPSPNCDATQFGSPPRPKSKPRQSVRALAHCSASPHTSLSTQFSPPVTTGWRNTLLEL